MARTPKAASEFGSDENNPNTIIQRIHNEIPSLTKDSRNSHGGWSYPSIDQYYQEVAPVAFRLGYTWKLTCTDVKTFETDLFLMLWNIDVYAYLHGEDYGGPVRIPVLHHYDGPQTTGMVFSYAEKIFMRTMFKVVTGEKDADASAKVGAKSSLPPERQQKFAAPLIYNPATKSFGDQEMPLLRSLEVELGEVISKEDLLAFATRRNADIIKLRRENPIEWSALLEQYDAIKNKFVE